MKRDQYFPHEVNLRQTSEFMHLIEKEGMAGYGIYWGLIEYLRSQDNYTGDFRVLKTLAVQMKTSTARLYKILKEYDLFEFTDFTFRSTKLNAMMSPLERKRKLMNEQVSDDHETTDKRNRHNSLKTSTTSDTVKKSKVKKSKEYTSSAEETASSSTPSLSIRLPWETYVDELDKEQHWKEIMAMRSGLKKEFFTLYPRIIDGFKEHVRALGKESAILSSSDAKRYFCCYFTPGSYTYQQLMVQLKQPDKDHNPYEERDPTTGQRSYCGVPIPDGAPPRPNAQAVWNEETHQWNF